MWITHLDVDVLQEARLEVGVRTFRSGNWSFVAAYVGDDVTAKQCSKRWRKITKKRAGQSEEEV